VLRRLLPGSVKSAIRRLVGSLGYRLVPADGPLGRASMEDAMQATARRGHALKTVVDIGASNGSWSAALMRHFPDCRYLLVEAQPVHEPALREFCARHRQAQFVLAAAGPRDGRIYFDASEPLSGQASETPFARNNIEVPVVTIDAALRDRAFEGPYLLKFDTHGFELPVLAGATQTLSKTEVIIMECYNFRIAPQALTFDEMCAYLGQRGFRCIDLVEPMHRPYDGAFWQMDLVFVRSDRPEFGYATYR
jgi:FkbM family methyltransferase